MKPHMSISSLQMLQKCGVQFEFRYVRGIKSPPGVALVIGKGVHAAAEGNLRNKLEWGELLPVDAVRDTARDATAKLWSKDEPVRTEEDPDQGEAIDAAVGLSTMHHLHLAPKIEPVALERGFRLEMPGAPFDIVGYVDVEEEGRIRDLKTTTKAPQENAARISDQLTLYHLNATVRGEPAKTVALDHLVKTKAPKVVTQESTRSAVDHTRLMARFEAAARAIASGSFVPAAADSWACSPRFCGYWDRCAWGSRKQVSVGLIDPSRLTSRVERRPG